MHLPNPFPNDLYRGQMFAPMATKHKTPLTTIGGCPGRAGSSGSLLFLEDAGPDWRAC